VQNLDHKYLELLDFIKSRYPASDFLPLHSPVFLGNEKKYVEDCIESTFVSSVGKYVDQFEEGIARYTGSKKTVACVNGTSALHIALLLKDVQPGTEVITQALSFVATANAISYCGANPLFLDVDPDSLGLSVASLKDFLETETKYDSSKKRVINLRTGRVISACVPMHTFGHPVRIEAIVSLCKEYNIPVIEDAAESLGSFQGGQHTGTFGELGILSFNGNKIITTGGGGMIITNNEELATKAKHLTTTAKMPHAWDYVHDEVGYNYRLTNISAAIGVGQLELIDEILDNKRQTANLYAKFCSENGIQFISEPENASSNYWLNAIVLKDKCERDAFLSYSNSHGVMTRPIWGLLNNLKMYEKCPHGNLNNSKWLEDRVVNIPSGYSAI
jgi:perosamine synthetase